ncbi:MAG: hypothetical protein ACPGVU_12050 [Limisphaerales bacterium]
MKHFTLFLLLTLGLEAAETTKLRSGDMFTPDIVLHFGKQLKLTDEQMRFIRDENKSAKRDAKEPQERIAAGNAKLARMMAKSITGEDEAVAQVKRITGEEVKLKLIQWRMLVRVKNQLNSRACSKT